MSGDVRDVSETDWTRFEVTILPYLDAVFRFALWLTRDRQDAQDLVQETFSEALASFHRFEPGTNARAWLLAILRHVHSHRRRRDARAPQTVAVDEVLESVPAVETTPQCVTDEEILHALSRLPLEYQEVVVLADVEDLSYKEIATTVRIPLGTVMSRLHRARRLLRTALASYAAAHGIGRRSGDSTKGDSAEVPR